MSITATHAPLAVLVLATLSAAFPAWAGDPEHGRVLAARCAACHGPTGVPDDPQIPKLAGQNGLYLYEQLLRFKEGVRMSPIMSPIAESLTTLDMSDVATYFAGLNQAAGLPPLATSAAPAQPAPNH